MSTIGVHRTVDEAMTTAVHELYDEVFSDQPNQTAWRQMWDLHSGREGFRIATAHQGPACVGFVYGYTGQAGQWWTDEARRVLPAEVGDRWLGGHFEVVSLAVSPDHRGAGIGRALMESLLETVPHQRAVLMTDARGSHRAHRLYSRTGWRALGAGLRPGTVIMGKTLR